MNRACMCVPKFPFFKCDRVSRAFQAMLLVSQGTSPSIDEAKPEAQATSQTNLGTGMLAVVKKAVTFARKLGTPIIGIVENMSRFVCPHCGARVYIFQSGGGKKIAEELGVPFLGGILIDQEICEDADNGIVEHSDSPASKAFMEVVKRIEPFLENKERLESSPKLLYLSEELTNE